jgi:hypothetical protein
MQVVFTSAMKHSWQPGFNLSVHSVGCEDKGKKFHMGDLRCVICYCWFTNAVFGTYINTLYWLCLWEGGYLWMWSVLPVFQSGMPLPSWGLLWFWRWRRHGLQIVGSTAHFHTLPTPKNITNNNIDLPLKPNGSNLVKPYIYEQILKIIFQILHTDSALMLETICT